jgi:hypothetical protein
LEDPQGFAVVFESLGQSLVLGLGKGQADCFAGNFGGPEIIGAFFDFSAMNAAEQGAADDGAVANPWRLGQLLLAVAIG